MLYLPCDGDWGLCVRESVGRRLHRISDEPTIEGRPRVSLRLRVSRRVSNVPVQVATGTAFCGIMTRGMSDFVGLLRQRSRGGQEQ
jgi:hypothetical protein